MYGYVYIWSVDYDISSLDHGWIPKKACPQQLLQTVNEHDKYTVIKITVMCVSFRRNKVIQHCKKIKMLMGYIFLM